MCIRDSTSTLLTAAGAPEEITQSVENLAEIVSEVAVPEAEVKEFIDEAWNTAPGDDGQWQELPPLTLADNFGDAATINENEELKELGFDHEEHGGFRAQHGMMQFISADTNAVFTENDTERLDLTSTLLTAAGAPEEITQSVENLAEIVSCLLYTSPSPRDGW